MSQADNPYYKELCLTQKKDTDFARKFLPGKWKIESPHLLSSERLFELSSGMRKAEFVTLEETISMAYELLELRKSAKEEV